MSETVANTQPRRAMTALALHRRPVRRWFPVFLAAAIGLAMTACDRGESPTGLVSSGAAAPSASRTLQLLQGEGATEQTVQVVIDRKGGEVHIAGNILSIPPQAVTQPTLFVARTLPNGVLGLDLKAYQHDATGAFTVDVGSRGFARNLNLMLTYASYAGKLQERRTSIVWLVEDSATGVLAPLVSEVDTNRNWVRTRLQHFSQYAIAVN